MAKNAPPSLVEICLQSLIAHVKHLNDLNNIPVDLLEKIIPRLGAQELARLEDATPYLSEHSNDRWIQLYDSTFGEEDFNHARRELINYGQQFSWGSLFRARSSLLKTEHEDLAKSLSASYEKGESSRRKRSAKVVSNMYSCSERVEESPRVLNKMSPCYNKKPSLEDDTPGTLVAVHLICPPSKVRSVEVAVYRITETTVSRTLLDDETGEVIYSLEAVEKEDEPSPTQRFALVLLRSLREAVNGVYHVNGEKPHSHHR